jgi:hypothetical protein
MSTPTEQRRQILEMLAEGKITADEAGHLIDSVDRSQAEEPGSPVLVKTRPKYLRVVVNSTDTSEDGATRVNIRVPVQLLRAGVRLAALVPPQALAKVNSELNSSGLPIDLAELKPEHIDELIDHLAELTIDVDEAGSTVRIFAE